jgi:HD-like signal output (HDOD) protein
MTPQDLVAKAGALGSLPESWQQLDLVCSKPTVTTDMIAEIVSTDAGLTTRLLRIANSPMFGLPGRVEEIGRAVSLMGTKQVRDLALAACVIDRFKDVPETLVSMASFWRHSLGCALLARALATRRRSPNIERFFVIGLLHDLGVLLMCQLIPQETSRILTQVAQGQPLVATERSVLGFDHGDVGQALLEAWGLPQSLSLPVGRHHCPGAGAAYAEESALLHLASTITDLMAIGGTLEGRPAPLEPGAWDLAALPTTVLADALGEMDQSLDPVIKAFFPAGGNA